MERNEIKQTVEVVRERERERESKRVEKTCSVCDAQKIEEIEKGFNIKLGYFEMEKFISNMAELFVLQRSDWKQMQKNKKQRRKICGLWGVSRLLC